MDKKPKKFLRILKSIGLTVLGLVLNNQKGIKGTNNVDVVNDVVNELKKD